MIAVKCTVNIYELDGKDHSPQSDEKLEVLSHWNEERKIVLSVGGHRYTVVAKDLEAAIENASNISRY